MRYRLVAFTGEGGPYLKSLRLGGREMAGEILDLGGSASVEAIFSRQTASVTGVVHAEGSEQPAAGVHVVLIPQEKDRREDLNAHKIATTDQAGRFAIRDIVPGEYRAYAWVTLDGRPPDYMDPDVVRPAEGKGVPVTLGEGASANIELSAIPPEKQ
jgi:hypothetical protein